MLHDGNQVAFVRLMRLRYWLFSAAALEFVLSWLFERVLC